MIHLRKIEPSDLPLLYRWENDSAQWADGQTHNPLSQADLRRYIQNSSGDIYRDGALTLIIRRGDAAIGLVELGELDARNGRAEVGIYIESDERNKGVGAQTIKRLTEYAFRFLHLRLLVAKVRADNLAAQRIFEHNGFRCVATLPNWIREGDVKLYFAEPNLNDL